MNVRDTFGALEERPFRLLWIGRTTSAAGDALIGIGLAFAIIDIGGSASELGLVLATFTLARLIFILAGGVWADRLPRRLVMLACDVVRGIVDVFVAVALLTGAMELWMFYVTAFFFGAAQAFFGPASTGLIPQTVSAPRLQQANALLALSQTGTSIFGPAAAGLIIVVWSPGVVFAVDAATFVVSAIALARLPLAKLPPIEHKPFFADLRDGFRETWSHGWMRAGLAASAIANLGIAALFVLGPLIAEDQLGGAGAWGIVLTGGAIGGTLGGALALRLHPRRPLVASFVAWSFGVLPLLALAPPLPAIAIAVANAAFALGIVYGNAVWETVVQREIPAERLSRVSSFDWLVSICFMPIGQAVAGPASETFGRSVTLAVAAALIASSCAAGLLAPTVRSMRRVTPSPSQSPSFGASDSADELPGQAPPTPLP